MVNNPIVLKCGPRILNIDPDQVTHIQVDDYLCTVHCEGSNSHSCCQSLKKLAKELPDNFQRISRSCIINLSHVLELDVRNRSVRVSEDEWLAVSRSKWKNLKIKLKEHTSEFVLS
ncbi:LytR/AlgR family response regulator transcription factor [Pleomorphovibrio marinus]|uniref:LytR/AlgR family response regulator transcription factor n=1 Tax=Pleomorphovibrio marinus TaxID=2164132 RepID=UPI000E0B39A5|nr:LytTR family DNA-binding domain-containing protein [Pleomorphovibrio marinus]